MIILKVTLILSLGILCFHLNSNMIILKGKGFNILPKTAPIFKFQYDNT